MNNRYFTHWDKSARDDYASDEVMLRTNAAGYAEYGGSFDVERVRNDYYIMYPVEGEFFVVLNGEKQTARKGDLVFFCPGEVQRYYKLSDEEFKYYWVHFTGYAVHDILKACKFEKSGIYHVGMSDKIVQCFNKHFSDLYGKPLADKHVEISAAAHLIELLAMLRATMEDNTSKPGSTEKKVYASARFINENYALPLSVENLAGQQGLCSGYYSRMFTRYFGTSPQNYIIRIRLQNACVLLQQSNLSITQIAQAVGYEDSLYFSRIFRKKLGMSPASYRMMYRRNTGNE